MNRYIGGVAALALLLTGCGSGQVPAAQTVTSTVTSVTTKTAPIVVSTVATTKTAPTTVVATIATTRIQTSTVVETTTVAAGIDFDPVHTDVRTAGSPAFDGWTNDSMAAIERMVCGIYTPKDNADAAGKAGTVSALLTHLGVSGNNNVSTFKAIVTGVCPESLGYLPVF